MENEKIKIFTYAHKKPEYGFDNDGLHFPVHVGKDLNLDTYVCDLCDNTGDNISKDNDKFNEMTGIYWVLKNQAPELDVVGNEHYRRRFGLKKEDIVEILKVTEGIIPNRVMIYGGSVFSHFSQCHGKITIAMVKEILLKLYPEYEKDWEKYIENGNILLISNMCILKKDDFIDMYNFVFSILFKFKEIFALDSKERIYNYLEMFGSHYFPKLEHPNLTDWKDYQRPIFGYIAERLVTLFIFHNFKSLYEAPIIKYEGIR